MRGPQTAGQYAITADGGIAFRKGTASFPCYHADGKIVAGASFLGFLPNGAVYFATAPKIYAGRGYFTLYTLAGTIAHPVGSKGIADRINNAKPSEPHDTGEDSGDRGPSSEGS